MSALQSFVNALRGAARLGRLKLELSRVKRARQRTLDERSRAIADLGQKAWQLEAREEDTEQSFDALRTLEEREGECRRTAEGLRAAMGLGEAESKKLEEEHGREILAAKTRLEELLARSKEATAERKRAEKSLKSEGGAEELGTKELERKVERRAEIETAARTAVKDKKKEVAERQKALKEALEPVRARLGELKKRLRAEERRLAEMAVEKTRKLAQFGADIARTRPSLSELAGHFEELDAQDAEIEKLESAAAVLEGQIGGLGKGGKRIAATIAVLAATGALAWGAWALRDVNFARLVGETQAEMTVRVLDRDAETVDGASVVLFFPGGPVAQYTDIHGSVTLKLDEARARRGRLVVEKVGFKIHEQEVSLTDGSLIDVRLGPPDPEQADVIVRALDSGSSKPVRGAEILLVQSGDLLSQVTDSNGITKFTLGFLEATADAEMSIQSKGFEIKHQRVSLLPDQMQSVNLDREEDAVKISKFEVTDALDRNFREIEGTELLPGTKATGSARAGTVTKYTFPGHLNTPVLFALERLSGELAYRVEIYDPKDFLIAQYGKYYGYPAAIPFTPSADGDYDLHVVGVEGGGSYDLKMSYLSGPPEKRNQVEPLTLERSEKGMLAKESFDEYQFAGSLNTPLLITAQRSSGNLSYGIEIYDSADQLIMRQGKYYGNIIHLPFTPPKEDVYRLRIFGYDDFGSYTVALDFVAGEADQRITRILTPEEEGNGRLAAGAYDDYYFEGSSNTSAIFTVQRSSGSLVYGVEFYDPQNRRLKRLGKFYDGVNKIPFTPNMDGQHVFRVYGAESFGGYTVSMELWAGEAMARQEIPVLEVGTNYRGRLAEGAWDELQFAGQSGRELTFSTQGVSGSMQYSIEVLDPEGEPIARHGRFYGELQSFNFTPQADGSHMLRISTSGGFGVYLISLD